MAKVRTYAVDASGKLYERMIWHDWLFEVLRTDRKPQPPCSPKE